MALEGYNRRSSTFHQGFHASLYTQSGDSKSMDLKKAENKSRTHLETELSGLNGSHVSTRFCNKNALI